MVRATKKVENRRAFQSRSRWDNRIRDNDSPADDSSADDSSSAAVSMIIIRGRRPWLEHNTSGSNKDRSSRGFRAGLYVFRCDDCRRHQRCISW